MGNVRELSGRDASQPPLDAVPWAKPLHHLPGKEEQGLL